MTEKPITRVQYYPQQYLRTQDFTDEQAYHMAMRRRHNLAHHTWGIVYGLNLVVDPETGPAVMPGLAIDGYGRELILAEKRTLPVKTSDNLFAAFDHKDSDLLDVWLIYIREGSDPAAPGYVSCQPNGALPATRWRENVLLRLTAPDPNNLDRRQPAEVLPGDRNFTPMRTPPDEGQWPVFLGQISRNPAQPGQLYGVDLSNRPYACLVGEAITAPSGRTQVQVGLDDAQPERRFAVFIPEAEKISPNEPLPPRLEIDQAGQTNIRGDVKVQGKLSVKNHSIAWTPIDGTKQTVPKKPHPWQIYYAIVEAEQPATEAQQAGQPKPVLHQLRIEMGEGIHDANQLPTNQVVIGAWSPTEKIFKPCLTVSNNRSVKVHGNLIIEGRLTETQSRPEQRLTPEARNVALSSSLTGIAGASALLPKFYESKFGTPQAFLTDLLSSKETMQTLFASVQSEQQRQNFATKLVEVQNQLLQQVVVEKLITDTPTLVVAPLLKARERMQIIFAAVTAAQSTDFASQLATNQELLKAVVAELVVEPMRMQLFFAAVPAAQSADFAGQLAANAELVTAIVSELLKNKERMTLIIKGLTPAQYADFANVLATKAALLKAVTMELLTTKTRMKSLFKTIPAARYADFAELLVAESELWQVVIAKHVAAIVDSLVDTQLDTLVKQLAADQPRRQTLVTALTADETIRPELAASLWSHADDVGIKALAESLNQAGNQGESRLKAFVDSLSDERKAALKTMICGEVTPPDTPGGG